MNRVKAVAASLRVLESSLATRVLVTRNQVTHFSLNPLPRLDSRHNFQFPVSHRKLYFSTKPSSIVDLVLTNDWSQAIELSLENSCPSMTHETVIYVIKRLDKNPEKASCFFNWVINKDWFRSSSSVFSLIVRILATKDTMKLFWITLGMTKEKGFYLNEETYLTIFVRFKKEKMNSDAVALTQFYNRMLEENAMQSVVTKVVGIISVSEWGEEVMGELAKLKILLSDNFVLRVLKELRNTPLKSYKFFRWVGTQPGYEHNTVTYNAFASVLARNDSIQEFWSVIEEMKSVGHQLDIDTYIKISRQLQKNRMMEDAVKLYEHMMDGSYKPLVQDCILLLKSISASDKPNLDLVFRVTRKYESTGHTLSKAIYDGIHRSLTGAGKFDEAENIVRTMRNAGHEPDNITYSQLVFGLCKMRRFEEACKVLEEMQSCGCIPDIKTWTILIQGHCDAMELDKALLCFSKMIEKDCYPDADLLDVLVDGFLSQKRIEGAYKLLIEISRKCRISPWQATYKKLIEKLLEDMKFEEALELLRLMKTHNYPPYHLPFVPYISKFGSVEDAEAFLKALSVKSYPSHAVYVQVFESLFEEGRLSEAKDLLYKTPHHIRTHIKISKLFGSSERDTQTPQLPDP
ncbi:pentatricopeptide repeat-containing protein At3g48250, chloroplastic-like [Vigna umbellata]|uniref:pentatricopeptide repeat-containing protein At3g48250, chloroplastic-like n=1 Tax=Vigna umbellata TaxID=87088 RepID=UPI001F5F6B55|nr:pentatricopeptide repeat-containing protein At3g48250, chloroplastic-like [Vigna umbellata]